SIYPFSTSLTNRGDTSDLLYNELFVSVPSSLRILHESIFSVSIPMILNRTFQLVTILFPTSIFFATISCFLLITAESGPNGIISAFIHRSPGPDPLVLQVAFAHLVATRERLVIAYT